MKTLLALVLGLSLVGCAPKISLDKYNADIELANSEISKANATIQALNATATALAPRLETAEAGYVAMSAAAEAAESEASSQRTRAQALVATITKLAPTPTPPCPLGEVISADGKCIVPTPTTAPTPTKTFAQKTKTSGIYLIGPEIAPGYWRGTSRGDNCYWEIDSASGNIVDNHFGSCTSIMFVPDWATSVEINDGIYAYCGSAPTMCPVVN